MPSIQDLGLLADAVYETPPIAAGWVCTRYEGASGHLNGFQAATFSGKGATVIAFRGTAQAMDAIADLKLGTGMNSTYFSAAEAYASMYKGQSNVIVCGHSLGGAIAQVVANRQGFRLVSFNAPGVAVFASRNMGDATVAMTAIRTAGMLASTLRHPMQAARDVRATFNVVQGVNICLANDVVSRMGNHYGDVIRISGTSANPLTEHKMTTVNAVLAVNPIGRRDAASF